MQLTLSQAIIATICIALVILCERTFPFALFSKKEPPAIIRFIEQYIPPMVMAALVIYCLKEVQPVAVSSLVPNLAGILVTFIAYKWKHNSLVAIFGGTIVYMILIRVL
ncbi:MAG: AzlD domain-containing protein [Treponema sp.]|nr:AzlD domain-containing protein [Treponema sp.]